MKNYYYNFSMLWCAVLLTVGFLGQAQNFTNGIFVLNEGGAGSGNASVSYISDDFSQLQNNIFGSANSGAALGDTGQSIGFNGDYAYVVLNISNEIKVVNRLTFQLNTTITGFANPRYIAFHDNFAYVTCWGSAVSADDDYVAIVDLSNNTILSTISVNEGPERIIVHAGKLYVAHQGGYGFGSSVSVIDPSTNTVSHNIAVGDVPNSIVAHDGFLYVLCGGKPSWSQAETDGILSKIDPLTNLVVGTTPFVGHPSNLEIAGNDMFYSVDAEVFKSELAAATLPTTPLFSIAPQGVYGIYGMDIIDNVLYVADAVDYASPGTVFVYSLQGVRLQEFTVGVIPNSFYKTDASLATNPFNRVANAVVYPNPTTDKFYVHSDQNAAVALYDLSGRLVKKQQDANSGVGVSDLQAGIYVVSITIGNQTSTIKLIVK